MLEKGFEGPQGTEVCVKSLSVIALALPASAHGHGACAGCCRGCR